MRYLLVGANYWPEPIGISVYTTAYAEALAAAGHDVTVVTGYPHYPEWSSTARRWRVTTEEVNGVRVRRVPHSVPGVPSALGRASLEASFGAAASVAIGGIRFDAAIGVIPSLSSGLAARAHASVRRKPYGLLVQDLVSAAAAQGGVPGAGRRVVQATSLVERRVLHSDMTAVVARGFLDAVGGLSRQPAVYLPNFCLLPPPSQPRRVTRAQLGLGPMDFVVTYSGNLGFKQDFDSVLRAAERMRDERDVRWLIVGDGSQRQHIADEVAARGLANVELLPLQPQEEVPNVLAASDVLLAPQRPTAVDMSVPSKLTAYMASGRPVLAVASQDSETARLVRESGGGIVVPPGDVDQIVASVRMLHADRQRREALGARARAFARWAFAAEGACARWVEFAEALAERRPYGGGAIEVGEPALRAVG